MGSLRAKGWRSNTRSRGAWRLGKASIWDLRSWREPAVLAALYTLRLLRSWKKPAANWETLDTSAATLAALDTSRLSRSWEIAGGELDGCFKARGCRAPLERELRMLSGRSWRWLAASQGGRVSRLA